MKDLKIDSLFDLFEKKKFSIPTLLLQGEDAYLEREIKDALKAFHVEIKEVDLKKTGPESALEDASMGGSLFSSSQALWIKKVGAPSQWTKAAHATWIRMRERADGQSFLILLQAPLDKRLSFASLEVDSKVSMAVDASQKLRWIQKINAKRKADLSAEKLRFLAEQFDEPLLMYDQWIDLWTLGGDAWAEVALGWRDPTKKTSDASTSSKQKMLFAANENPAYLWVDAVLRGQHKLAIKLVNHLLEEGSEPLQLLALLSKSVRIMAHLEAGQPLKGQADFIVQKIRGVLQASSKKGRGALLLKRCVEMDRRLKSSQTNARAMITRLSL